jgi:hypothetical protein
MGKNAGREAGVLAGKPSDYFGLSTVNLVTSCSYSWDIKWQRSKKDEVRLRAQKVGVCVVFPG